MITEEIKKENIDLRKESLNNYIIYYFDSLKFGIGEIKEPLDFDNIYEAFLFNKNKCLHIYREEGVIGTLFTNEEKDKVLFEKQIAKNNKKIKHLVVKKYIEFDEDGQGYISMILPSELVAYQEEV